MVSVTEVLPRQLVPDPPAVQLWTPELKDVIAKFPAVPPDPTVVTPERWGNAAIPADGVTAEGVASPIVIDSVTEKEDPAVVTANQLQP